MADADQVPGRLGRRRSLTTSRLRPPTITTTTATIVPIVQYAASAESAGELSMKKIAPTISEIAPRMPITATPRKISAITSARPAPSSTAPSTNSVVSFPASIA